MVTGLMLEPKCLWSTYSTSLVLLVQFLQKWNTVVAYMKLMDIVIRDLFFENLKSVAINFGMTAK